MLVSWALKEDLQHSAMKIIWICLSDLEFIIVTKKSSQSHLNSENRTEYAARINMYMYDKRTLTETTKENL